MRLVLFLVAALGLGLYFRILPTLAVVVAIVAMIMIHEGGHYLTAKLSGMKVTEYFLGFGPKVWSFRRGETEYGVKALPLGGYVKIIGMSSLDEVPEGDEARTYRQASFPRRVMVTAAGSVTHFVMAFLILVSILVFYGISSSSVIEVNSVASFQGGSSPALAAGLKAGDIIEDVNGRAVKNVTVLSSAIDSSVGRKVALTVLRGSTTLHLTVVPVSSNDVKVNGKPYLPAGTKAHAVIGTDLVAGTRKLSLFSAFSSAGRDIGSYTVQTITALGSHFSPHGISSYYHELVHPTTSPTAAGTQTRFASPVGIVRLASQAANSGLETVLELLFSINVFIGVFNMIPLLPLDGGHVAIAIYERIRSVKGRKYHVDVLKLMPITYVVIGVLVLLSATALYLDVTHPIGNPFG